MDDWRLNGQEEYLKGVNLKHINFSDRLIKKEGWDHEHCDFCWEKISEYDGDRHDGYCTEDEYHWICEECFNDFRGSFDWKII